MTVKGWWNAPNPPHTVLPLFNLIKVILLDAVGWIGDDGVKSVVGYAAQPFKAVSMDYYGTTHEGVGILECIRLQFMTGVYHVDSIQGEAC